MTLASRLLEGYCPEGYDIVEEGLTPDVVMERTNSICIECIQTLYEAAENFFTGDLVSQAQVLTEGAGVIDKIKELIGNFVEKIKKIWDWFVTKVKKFPGWLKSLFSKTAESTDKIIEKIEEKIEEETKSETKSEDSGTSFTASGSFTTSAPAKKKKVNEVTVPDLNAVNKYAKEVGDIQAKVTEYSNELTKMYMGVDFEDLLDKAVKIGTEALSGDSSSIGTRMADAARAMYKNDGREARNEKLDEYAKSLMIENGRLGKAKDVVTVRSKVLECAKNIRRNIVAAESKIIKPIENSVKVVEKLLSNIQKDSFKTRLENSFTAATASAMPEQLMSHCASGYIHTSVKILTEITADLNKLMSTAQSIIKGYNDINSKLVRAVRPSSSGDDN